MRSYRQADEPSSGTMRNMSWRTLIHDMRNELNLIIATCELLNLEFTSDIRVQVQKPVASIKAQASLAADVIQQLGSEETKSAEGGTRLESCERIVKAAREILVTIQEIGKNCSEASGVAITKDLLQMEFAVHRLSRLAEDAGRAVSQSSRAGLIPGPALFQAPSSSQPASSVIEVPATPATERTVLIADDDENNREILRRLLKPERYRTILASSGGEVLSVIKDAAIDLVLLDLVMPGLNGFDVLHRLRNDPCSHNIPVVVVSSIDEIESVAACIEAGAADYVLKPVNSTILRARVRSLLEKKQAHEWEQARMRQLHAAFRELEVQKDKTDLLLKNILPQETAEELKVHGRVAPRYFEDITVVFTDFVSFTASTETLAADDLVLALNDYFSAFDAIVDRYQLERLKTVGDSYIFVCGMPKKVTSHPVDAVLASMEMLEFVKLRQAREKGPARWSMRIGINTGPVIAGVVGTRKFAFDVWGETVNSASRLVSSGQPNRINLSADTFHRVKEFFACTPRGEVRIKGDRWREMYFVDDILPSLLSSYGEIPPATFAGRYRQYFHRELTAFPAGTEDQALTTEHGTEIQRHQLG